MNKWEVNARAGESSQTMIKTILGQHFSGGGEREGGGGWVEEKLTQFNHC